MVNKVTRPVTGQFANVQMRGYITDRREYNTPTHSMRVQQIVWPHFHPAPAAFSSGDRGKFFSKKFLPKIFCQKSKKSAKSTQLFPLWHFSCCSLCQYFPHKTATSILFRRYDFCDNILRHQIGPTNIFAFLFHQHRNNVTHNFVPFDGAISMYTIVSVKGIEGPHIVESQHQHTNFFLGGCDGWRMIDEARSRSP